MKHQGVRANTGLLRIRIMFPNEVTCLHTECCFSELALQSPTKRLGLVQSEHHRHSNVVVLSMIWLKKCSLFIKQQSHPHSKCFLKK